MHGIDSDLPLLARAARLIALIVGIQSLLMVGIPVSILVLIDAMRSGVDANVQSPDIVLLVGGFVPIVLAIVAWRCHLVGGLAIVLFTAAFLPFALQRVFLDEYQRWISYPFHLSMAIPFFIGGMLHLVVWRIERQSKKRQQS
jgi:hypothetical protein